MNDLNHRVFARATRDLEYDRHIVILSDGDCGGRAQSISATAIDMLRELIRYSSRGLKLSKLSPAQLSAVENDIECVLGVQLRRNRRPGYAVLASTTQIVDRRTLISEAA